MNCISTVLLSLECQKLNISFHYFRKSINETNIVRLTPMIPAVVVFTKKLTGNKIDDNYFPSRLETEFHVVH